MFVANSVNQSTSVLLLSLNVSLTGVRLNNNVLSSTLHAFSEQQRCKKKTNTDLPLGVTADDVTGS